MIVHHSRGQGANNAGDEPVRVPQVERPKGRLGELIDQYVDDEELILLLDQLISVIDQLKVDADNEELGPIGQLKVELKESKISRCSSVRRRLVHSSGTASRS